MKISGQQTQRLMIYQGNNYDDIVVGNYTNDIYRCNTIDDDDDDD